MGVIAHKEQERNTELNDRIAADLRARTQSSEREDPDMVEGSDYTKNLKKTSHFGWVWIVLIVLAIASLVMIATM